MKDVEGATKMCAKRTRGADASREHVGTVVELFAGVGGFRLGLEGVPEQFRSRLHHGAGYDSKGGRWKVVWANQYEPATPRSQHAWDCYTRNFGVDPSEDPYGNRDIADVDAADVPDHDLLVGGFPCQDYSVAKPLNQAHGIKGKKGVLWWEIKRIIEEKRPRYVLLENVDRLLKSPGNQRGRDFAIVLATLSELGYCVEWRVINAADYGFPQRRRRVFILARRRTARDSEPENGFRVITEVGVLARALPCTPSNELGHRLPDFIIDGALDEVSASFGLGSSVSPFENSGFMCDGEVWTQKVVPAYSGLVKLLGDVVSELDDVPVSFRIPEHQLGEPGVKASTWRYLKGPKSEPRRHAVSDAEYRYSEGGMSFPDPLTAPARTILTGEGGSAPSRFKHAILQSGVYRRLTPLELERLNGFPDGWTEGMPDTKRAFCMGNALVVGVVREIGDVLAADAEAAHQQ